jgi:hypothetical protein
MRGDGLPADRMVYSSVVRACAEQIDRLPPSERCGAGEAEEGGLRGTGPGRGARSCPACVRLWLPWHVLLDRGLLLAGTVAPSPKPPFKLQPAPRLTPFLLRLLPQAAAARAAGARVPAG